MFTCKIGDLFASTAQTKVNTVNCVGAMGKGIALEFKKRYPTMFKDYKARCASKMVKPGIPYYYYDLLGTSILNFPTKNHWKSPSKLEYVVEGLNWFRDHYEDLEITSIAFPPLGCGNGGLSWEVVGPIMYSKLKDLPIDIEVYAPYGTNPNQLTEEFLSRPIEENENIIGNQSKGFNKYWYLILYVIQALNNDKYALRVGRTIRQKICYLLTRENIPTGFVFSKGKYGPYTKDVNDAIFVLSNANLMKEQQLGRAMIETRVADDFKLDINEFTQDEIDAANKVIDLMSRIKNTDQAEMLATVLFSFDQLKQKNKYPTEKEIYDFVINWKPHWKDDKDNELADNIIELSELGWINPNSNIDCLDRDFDLF